MKAIRNILFPTIILSVNAIFILTNVTSAQPTFNWQRQFDYLGREDNNWAGAVNGNGSIFTAGWGQNNSTDIRYVIHKNFANGSSVATDFYSVGTINRAFGITVKKSHVYVTGRSKVGAYYKYATVRNDTNLFQNQVSATYHNATNSNDYGQFVLANGNDDSIFVGGTNRNSGSNSNVILVKYASTSTALNQVVVTTFDGFNANTDDTLKAMTIDANNFVYIAVKSYQGVTNGWDYYVAKFGSDLGNEIWRHNYSSTADEEPNDIAVDASGNVYVTGNSGSNALTVKWNSSGTQQWAATYTNGQANAVAVFNNAVYVTGATLSGGNPNAILTVKYDANGTQKWANTRSGDCSNPVGYKIKIDTTGNAIYVGGGPCRLVFLKYDSSGNSIWTQTFLGVSTLGDKLNDMVADKNGNLVSVGYTLETIYQTSPDDQDFEVVSYNVGGGFSSKASFVEPPIANLTKQPSSYGLSQNYPNPFNPTTTLRFSLPEEASVVLKIYDMLGREVKTLMNGQSILKGDHEITFDASDLATGAYFYRIVANHGKFIQIKKMTLVK